MMIKDLETGSMYIAYVHSTESKKLQQAYTVVLLSKNDTSVHVIESNRLSKTVLKALSTLSFEELDKRDGNVIRLFYNTWHEKNGDLLDEKGNKIIFKKL